MRYEICTIEEPGYLHPDPEDYLGDVVARTDDYVAAKCKADEIAQDHVLGVAIHDTREKTIDWGNETTGLKSWEEIGDD